MFEEVEWYIYKNKNTGKAIVLDKPIRKLEDHIQFICKVDGLPLKTIRQIIKEHSVDSVDLVAGNLKRNQMTKAAQEATQPNSYIELVKAIEKAKYDKAS